MDYRVKVNIDGADIFEESELVEVVDDGISYVAPSLTSCILENNVCKGNMVFGAAACDVLTISIANPNKTTYDGSIVELWVAQPEDMTDDVEDEIASEVGSDTDWEELDGEDSDELDEDDGSEGDTATAEEIAEGTATELEIDKDLEDLIEGEDETPETETTSEEEEPEWEKIGTYYVTSQRGTDSIVLTCYDALAILTGTYTPTTPNATLTAHYNAIKSAILTEYGITADSLDMTDADSITVNWTVSASYRDSLGYIAGLLGGFVTVDEDGHIDISTYQNTGEPMIRDSFDSYKESSAGEMTVQQIDCQTSLTTALSSGEGQSLQFSNPFMTQTVLDDILADNFGQRLTGCKLITSWDTGMMAGNIIWTMTSEEYANYLKLRNDMASSSTQEKKSVLYNTGKFHCISSQTIYFEGEVKTVAICGASTEYATGTSSMTEIERMLLNQKIQINADIDYMKTNTLTKTMYCVHDSAVTAPTSGWTDTMPTLSTSLNGKYLWQNVYVSYDNGVTWIAGTPQLVNLIDGIVGFVNSVKGNGYTTIDGGHIETESITSTQIDTDELFAKELTATNFNITGGSVDITTSSESSDQIVLRHSGQISKMSPGAFRVTRTLDDSVGYSLLSEEGFWVSRQDTHGNILGDFKAMLGNDNAPRFQFFYASNATVLKMLSSRALAINNLPILTSSSSNTADGYAFDWGTTTITVDGTTLVQSDITFNASFTATPYVFTTVQSGNKTYSSCTAVTVDGATVNCWGISGSSGNRTVRWLAIGKIT